MTTQNQIQAQESNIANEEPTYGNDEARIEGREQNMEATYSVEDNKLRLYSDSRLSLELYNILKKYGFKYAPKQELFVAPKWTPQREDLCILLAETIKAEETTMLERAEAKAERFEGLSTKRASEAGAFYDAANRIGERFANGQPILIGHHSERGARKDQKRMHSAMDKMVKAQNAVEYWNYRSKGVLRHANGKNSDRTRLNRIKTLLADMRNIQRTINASHSHIDILNLALSEENAEKKNEITRRLSGNWEIAGYQKDKKSLYDQFVDNEISADDALQYCIDLQERKINSTHNARFIIHYLNRLDYERSQLGEVPRFEGELTPVILQAFARENGAEKPKATKDGESFTLKSHVPLPLHLSDSKELVMTENEWRDFMQSIGYTVVIKERKQGTKQACSLINPTPEEAEKLQAFWNKFTEDNQYSKQGEVKEVEQNYYSARSGSDYSTYFTVSLDEDGKRIWTSGIHKDNEKPPVCRIRIQGNGYGTDHIVVIKDKPQKKLPFDFDVLMNGFDNA